MRCLFPCRKGCCLFRRRDVVAFFLFDRFDFFFFVGVGVVGSCYIVVHHTDADSGLFLFERMC
jgi:hypothetical protein